MMKPSRASITVLAALTALPESIAFVPTLLASTRGRSLSTRPSSYGSLSKTTPSSASSVLFTFPNNPGTDKRLSEIDDETNDTVVGGATSSYMRNKRKLQPDPVLWKHMKPIVLTTALALTTLVMALPATAAMSGGRMGGSFSGSSRSMGPSRSSYSGGGYSRSYSGGYSGGYSGRSTTIIAPMPLYSPLFAPPVIYGGGVGALPVSRGISPFDLLFIGGFGFLFVSSFFNRPTMETSWSESNEISYGSKLGTGASVLSFSVAVEVPNRDDPNSLLSVLTRLSQTSNTGDRKGVQNLTSQVALEVLRRKSSVRSASSNYQHFRDAGKAEQQFNKWSVEQRSKFEQENANVFGGVDRSIKVNRPRKDDDNATMAVVTLVMAIQGDSTKIPKISNINSVEQALRMIASDAKVDDCLMSAEILWTPEDRSETLTRSELIADYPELIDV